MDTYIQYAYNLKGAYKFEKLQPASQVAVLSSLIRKTGSQNDLENAIERESDPEVLQYISENLDLKTYYRSTLFTSNTLSYVDKLDFNNIRAIINFRQVNRIQHPNKLFREVNRLLADAGIFIGRLETYADKKDRLYNCYGSFLGQVIWLADFVINRVIPRIPYLENLYYSLTNGEHHAISQSEVLGRLTYCGFDIIDFKRINGLSYYVVMKTREPAQHGHPSYYPIIRLSRTGRNGKMINVYKFRTMHPYSEYLQDYVIKMNGYNDKGKPANDFRVTRWGIMIRRLWLDELPQLINLIKGEMKLVGLRPLSQVRFNEFPQDLKTERIKYKPGCFPPYVALNMPDDKMNIEAERIYINDLKHRPYTTDIRYLLKAVYNIVTNKIRSS